MKEVWLVEVGEYSDYRVETAWSTEELALRRATKIATRHNSAGVLRMELDIDTDEIALKPGFVNREVFVFNHSSINGPYRYDESWLEEVEGECSHTIEYLLSNSGSEYVVTTVRGTDRERVNKVFTEQKAQRQALQDSGVLRALWDAHHVKGAP